jgi:ParB-like chromosome segregation protein Spo0J
VSLALDAPVGFGIDGEVEDLLISELELGEGVRTGGLDESHVDLLMESAEAWPPIVVWGEDSLVIDGFHRVEAARRLGRRNVTAVRFMGSAEEAFMESVRRNVNHGLPLTVGDRRRAARRVLTRNPEWSDRRIASLCGLSDKTVGRLRRAVSGIQVIDRRVGRDGKVRPVQAGQVRDRVRQALEENPNGSLRAIAAVAGASPETVRSVRANLLAREGQSLGGDAPASSRRTDGPALSLLTLLQPSRDEPLATNRDGVDWLTDRALSACGDGWDFARWFASNDVTEDWHRFVWTVPLGRVYDVVDEARRRAATWTSFASMLESRTR